MSVRFALLGLLRGSSSHGYQLKSLYDRLVGPDGSVPPAQVYSTLARLERDGLVLQSAAEQEGGPARRTYELTDEGQLEIEQWLAAPVEPAPQLQALLYTKVVLTILADRRIDPLLDAQREAHLQRMRELTVLRQRRETGTAVLAEYALFHLEADLRWLESISERKSEIVKIIDSDRKR